MAKKSWHFRLLAIVVIVPLLVIWIFQGPILESTLRWALEQAGHRTGWSINAGKIDAGFLRPWIFRQVRVTGRGTPLITAKADEITWHWNWISGLISPEGRVLAGMSVRNAWATIDFRVVNPPTAVSMTRSTQARKQKQSEILLRFLPKAVELDGVGAEIFWAEGHFAIGDISARFDEQTRGDFYASGMELTMGTHRQVFATQKAVTAWKKGEAFLADMEMRQGMKIHNLAVSLARPGGMTIDLQGDFFGGSVRTGAAFGELRGEPGVDAAVWASGVSMEAASRFLGFERSASGRMDEARLTFRGNPSRPLDAEASLRLAVDDVRWGARGWQTLEANASLINRRLVVSNLELKQEENSLIANGEVALSGDWRDVMVSPFLLNVSASILDLGSLSALVGTPFDEMSGRMSVSAVLSGRGRELNGFLAVEASDVTFRSHPIDSAKLDAAFSKGEARIQRLELWTQNDHLTGQGDFRLAAPHDFKGRMELEIADLGHYSWLGFPGISSGGASIHWQGDGTWKTHSGAFSASINKAVTRWTPRGLTASASGTYSPGNIYFGKFELLNGPLRLNMRATLAHSGIRLQDVSLHSARKSLAAGELFLPLDLHLLMCGQPWNEAFNPAGDIYAHLSCNEVSLKALSTLVGRDPLLSGLISGNLEASGSWNSPGIQGSLHGRNLRSSTEPPSSMNVHLDGKDGRIDLSADLTPEGGESVSLKLLAPLGTDPADRSLTGRLQVPTTHLNALQPFLSHWKNLHGILQGNVTISGVTGHPLLDGHLLLSNAGADLLATSLGHLGGRIDFSGTEVFAGPFTGSLGAGRFVAGGNVEWSDAPYVTLAARGESLLLHRSPDLELVGDVRLLAQGGAAEGWLSGAVDLTKAQILRKLQMALTLPGRTPARFSPPDMTDVFPSCVAGWNLDIAVGSVRPLDLNTGEWIPHLRMLGTLGHPTVEGDISISGAQVSLPISSLSIESGSIHFRASDPWMPVLNLNARTNIVDHQIEVLARGPLRNPQVLVRSRPPLSTETVIFLTSGASAESSNPLPPAEGGLFSRFAVGPLFRLGRPPPLPSSKQQWPLLSSQTDPAWGEVGVNLR